MFSFNAIFAFSMASLFTLVASADPNFTCNSGEVQTVVIEDCIRAANKFGGNGRSFSFKPYGNARCQETCQVTIKLTSPPENVSGTSETEGIAKLQVEDLIRAALGPQQCGRVGLAATVPNFAGKQVAVELKAVKDHCLDN